MCGRITHTSPRAAIAREFGITRFVTEELPPRYNIAPSQAVEAIIRDGDELRLGAMQWGLATPANPKVAPINARAETVAVAAPFREAFARRRCLVVADGFYEWRKDSDDGKTKTPHYIHLKDGAPFGLAGIWSFRQTPSGERTPTCAILTCAPNELMVDLHNRMPVILPRGARDRWLDPNAGTGELRALLNPFPADEMEAYPVSTLVNSPRNDSPELIEFRPNPGFG